jgi:ribosomal protein S8
MINKSLSKGEFRNLLSAVKLAVLSEKSYIMFPKKKYYYINLMSVLVAEGFIEGFEERGSYIIIYLKHTH